MNATATRILPVVLFACSVFHMDADSAPVTTFHPQEFNFSLPVVAPFSLPAVIVDYTIIFARSNLFNPGESIQIETFSEAGALLQTDTFSNSGTSSIIGCACWGGLLDEPLMAADFHIRISSLSGSFEVDKVAAVAYDASDGYGNSNSAIGILRTVPEPASGTLALGALAAALVTRRRTAAAHKMARERRA
jgi:uncharacterized protein (TIGR03382 family)